ncbi:phosphate ABC transporter permease, partial [Shewanella sp. 0m-11]
GVTIGGIMVFVALLLIFFYLLYVIKPIFDSAEVTPVVSAEYYDPKPALMVGSDEQNEIMYRVSQLGKVDFYDTQTSQLIRSEQINTPAGTEIVSSSAGAPSEQRFALGLSNGQVIIAGLEFEVTYPNDKRLITPKLRFYNNNEVLTADRQSRALNHLVFGYRSDKMSFVYQTDDKAWHLSRQEGEENMMTEEVEWGSYNSIIPDSPVNVQQQLMTPDQRQLILSSDNKLFIYDIRDAEAVQLSQVLSLGRAKANVTNVTLLAGASSLLVSYDTGIVQQYFQVNGEQGRQYQEIRNFKGHGDIKSVASEFYRKSFATITEDGDL